MWTRENRSLAVDASRTQAEANKQRDPRPGLARDGCRPGLPHLPPPGLCASGGRSVWHGRMTSPGQRHSYCIGDCLRRRYV